MSTTPAQIAQVNVTYQREEDRLLLRIRSTENLEFRLWLTRRYTQLLLRAIEKMLDTTPAAGLSNERERATRAFEHERFTATADRSTPYEETAQSFPLGEDGALGYRITVHAGTPATLELLPREGAGIALPGQKQLLHNLHHLLEQAAGSAEWNLQSALETGNPPDTRPLIN